MHSRQAEAGRCMSMLVEYASSLLALPRTPHLKQGTPSSEYAGHHTISDWRCSGIQSLLILASSLPERLTVQALFHMRHLIKCERATEHAGEDAKVNAWEAPTEVSRWKEEHVRTCGFV